MKKRKILFADTAQAEYQKNKRKWIPTVEHFTTTWTYASWDVILYWTPINLPESIVGIVSMYLYSCGLKKSDCMNVREQHIVCPDCCEVACPDSEDEWNFCEFPQCNRVVHLLCSNSLRECKMCNQALGYCLLHTPPTMCRFGHVVCSGCVQQCRSCKVNICNDCCGRCWKCTSKCKECVMFCRKCEVFVCKDHGKPSDPEDANFICTDCSSE